MANAGLTNISAPDIAVMDRAVATVVERKTRLI
jgi:hypothetical protein